MSEPLFHQCADCCIPKDTCEAFRGSCERTQLPFKIAFSAEGIASLASDGYDQDRLLEVAVAGAYTNGVAIGLSPTGDALPRQHKQHRSRVAWLEDYPPDCWWYTPTGGEWSCATAIASLPSNGPLKWIELSTEEYGSDVPF